MGVPLFETMTQNLNAQGYSVHKNALPIALGSSLWKQLNNYPSPVFHGAGIGRGNEFNLNLTVRTDETLWIESNTKAGQAWNAWMASLQAFLNARLFLGLFSFESHFARYQPGGFYQRHQDAFVGDGNRILSVVVYLNRGWVAADAGELVLFTGNRATQAIHVAPEFGTIVAFLSETFPHEVLKTNRDRHSIAGWFRANGSRSNAVDPPQ